MEIWNKYYNMAPMKYYQPLDYSSAKAQSMIHNEQGQYIAEQKFDGEWARLIKDGGKIVIQSRNISKVTGEYGDKTDLVPHIVADASQLPDGTVLLGELCFADEKMTSRDVGTILRCKAPKAIERQKNNKLIFRLFDCLTLNGTDLINSPYGIRFSVLTTDIKETDYIKQPVWVKDNFEDFLQEILARGGEGIVIHDINYLYSPGSRPAWSTLKVKRITTELELKVTAAIEPKRHYEGDCIESWGYWVSEVDGVMQYLPHTPIEEDKSKAPWEPVTKPFYNNWKNGVVVNNGGTLVRVTSGLTDEDREWLASDDAAEAIANGTLTAVVSAMEVTPDGSLRHPRLLRLRLDAQD